MAEQSYHHGNLREALLDRAEQAIEAEGSDALSLRQLARELGVSHGAPARHFRDRQALLDALALRGFLTMNALLARAAATDGDHRRRFRSLAHAYVTFAVAHPALLAAMYTLKHRPDAAELRDVGEQGMRVTRELIEEAQRAGAIRPGDADLLAHAGFAGLHGAATLVSGGLAPEIPAADLTDTLVDLLWAGMGGEVSGGG